MRALEDLYEVRSPKGWDLRVYDYTSNTWMNATEAFGSPGTFEMAVLTPPGGRPIRITLLPPGGSELTIDIESLGDVSLWRSLGIRLDVRHLNLLKELVGSRTEPVSIDELVTLLTTEGSEDARLILEELGRLRPGTSGEEGRGGGDP
jgi:hypothetical protein